MSKLYEQYKEMKKGNENSVILFKSGIFYIALAEDATFLSDKLSLKLTNFNGIVSKCGFPVSRFYYYSHLLNELSINYIILDTSNQSLSNSPVSMENVELKGIISYIMSLNFDCISFRESFDILRRIQELLKRIYKEGKHLNGWN